MLKKQSIQSETQKVSLQYLPCEIALLCGRNIHFLVPTLCPLTDNHKSCGIQIGHVKLTLEHWNNYSPGSCKHGIDLIECDGYAINMISFTCRSKCRNFCFCFKITSSVFETLH